MSSKLATKNIVEFAEAFLQAKNCGELADKNWKLILGLYDVSVSKGEMFVPETFYPKIQKWFGKIDDESAEDAVLRVEEQTIGTTLCYLFNSILYLCNSVCYLPNTQKVMSLNICV